MAHAFYANIGGLNLLLRAGPTRSQQPQAPEQEVMERESNSIDLGQDTTAEEILEVNLAQLGLHHEF